MEQKRRLPSLLLRIPHSFDPWENWGGNQQAQPFVRFTPNTSQDIIEIVKWAAQTKRKVRCSGFAHTWAPVYVDSKSQESSVLISMVQNYPKHPKDLKLDLPQVTPTQCELEWIRIVDRKEDSEKVLVKVGCRVTNEMFRVFCIQTDVTIPYNVVLVENTIVGTTSMCCHGSGMKHQTLADLIASVEWVDGNGNLRVCHKKDQPELLVCLAGSMGLFGVIVSLTLVCDVMTYARMNPQVIPKEVAIPPFSPLDSKQVQDFRDRIMNNYYNEFFLFSHQKEVWINCWNNDGKKEEATIKDNLFSIDAQEVSSFLADFINRPYFPKIPSNIQAEIIGATSLLALKKMKFGTLPLPDALHFKRGVHNVHVRDFECEIPIPSLHDGALPDFSIVQKAWWLVIDLMEEVSQRDRISPVNICLEMRVMNGSHIILAPQRGNKWTCSIEVLSLSSTPLGDWIFFCNRLIILWQHLLDEHKLGDLKPHWAKEHEYLTFFKDSIPYNSCDYLRQVYAKELTEFQRTREKENVDPFNLFVNDWFGALLSTPPNSVSEPKPNKRFLLPCCLESNVS